LQKLTKTFYMIFFKILKFGDFFMMRKSLIASLLAVTSWMHVEGGQYYNCGPLTPCEWSFGIRGGVEYMWYPDRRRNDFENTVSVTSVTSAVDLELELDLVDPLVDPILTIVGEVDVDVDVLEQVFQVDTVRTPHFKDQFDLPWTVVAEIGYALSTNTEIFADFHYGQANGKSNSYSLEFAAVDPLGPLVVYDINERYSDLEYLGGTIGLRHYFDGICGCAFPFFGVKAGVRHYDPVNARITATSTFFDPVGEVDVITDFDTVTASYYDSYNVVHGGFQLGLDFRINDCFTLVIAGEILGSCGLKAHPNGVLFGGPEIVDVVETLSDLVPVLDIEGAPIPGLFEATQTTTVTTAISALDVKPRKTYNILSFPVTVGLKFNF
jgi:hypothetical protein